MNGPILHFSALDFAVLTVFVAMILALGFSAKLRDNSVLQFIAAGRSLTLPVFVATLVSTWYGGILGIGESVSSFGLGTWVLMGVPYYVFAALYALYFAKRVRGAEQVSLPERLESRFGKPMALVGAGLVFLLALPAAHVLMLGLLVQAFTGWPAWVSLLVGAGVGTAFLYKGGLLADARVSILAFAMMYIGFAVIVGFSVLRESPFTAWKALQPPTLLTWDGGMGALYVASFFILGAWTLVDPGFHQRVASSRDPEVGHRGVVWGILCWFVFDLLTIATGMYALAWLPNQPKNKVLLFPAFGEAILPSGLKAIFVCGMLGTIVSAMVGYTLVAGSTVGREVVGRLLPGRDESQTKAWTRAGFALASLLACVLALQIQSVVSLWYAWSGAVVGALLIPVSLAYGLLWKVRSHPGWLVAGSIVAFTVSMLWMVVGLRTGNPNLDVTMGGYTFSLGTVLPGLAVSLCIAAVGEAVGRSQKA